jgi:hypothetical protein
MNRLVDLLWLRLPALVRRFWPTGGAALSDGAYLRRWPPVALAVPGGGFLLGALLGLVHPGVLYTYSLAVVTVMLVVAAQGAAIGLWVWLGYTLVDLVATDRSTLPGFQGYGGNPLLDGYVPLLLTYVLLAVLLVLGPLLAAAFGLRAAMAVRRVNGQLATASGYAVSVLILAGFAYAWAQATPFMIRPLWSFGGSIPDTEAVQPIQSHTGLLALFAGLAGLVRVGLTVAARRGPARPPAVTVPPVSAGTVAGGWLRLVLVPFQAGLVTLLFGGLVENLALGVLVFVLLCLLLAARLLVVPLLPGYLGMIAKVPVPLRIGASALVTYLLSDWIVTPAIDREERSFTSLLVVIFISLAIAAFLLPGKPPSGWPPGAQRAPAAPGPSPAPRGGGVASGGFPDRAAAVVGAVAVAAGLVVGWDRPAYADNCSGLTDCSFAMKIGLALIGIIIVALAIVLLPEILAGVGLEAAAVEGAELAGGEALGGMVSGGGASAGAFTAEEIAAAQAAAEAAGVEVGETVTAAEIDAVETHLSQFGPYGPNEAMINGIREAMAEGRALSVAEQNLMTHELTEIELMNQGMSQELAHEGALSTHDLYSNYSAEVIQQFAELFNSNWFKYWGL